MTLYSTASRLHGTGYGSYICLEENWIAASHFKTSILWFCLSMARLFWSAIHSHVSIWWDMVPGILFFTYCPADANRSWRILMRAYSVPMISSYMPKNTDKLNVNILR